MKVIIDQLDKLSQQYKYEEKVLIVDSYATGNKIITAFIRAGHHAINLKTKTVKQLATDLVEQFTSETKHYLDDAVGSHFVYTVLKQLADQHLLTYFRGMEVTPSFSNSLHRTITQLRLAGYASHSLNKQAFISPEKAADFEWIMADYEALMAANQFVDDAALIKQAITLAPTQDNTVYMLQSNLPLTKLEHKLLEQLLPDDTIKLGLPNILGIPSPNYHDLRAISWSEPTPFSYLYQLNEARQKPDLFLSTSKTEEVEIKHIFEQIKQSQAYLDESVIFYTKAEPYVTIAFQLMEKYQIPITFADGLPISFSRPGKLVKGLITWMKDKYSVSTFITLMNEGLFDFPEGAPSKTKISSILRDTKIGWDQARYHTQLQLRLEALNQKIAGATSDEQLEYYQKQLGDVTWLYEWFVKLFKHLPVVEAEMNYRGLLKGIEKLLKDYSLAVSALDEIAKAEMLERIEIILPYAEASLTSYDAFEKVTDLLLSLRINRSGPKPGHLHLSSYKQGLYGSWSHVFIVGLDNRSFPGTPSENPLLLDEERKQLSSFLPLLQETGKENVYTMLQILTLTNGQVSFSYCNFDINDNRTVSPSHLFLQGYRMAWDKPEAEFKDVKTIDAPLTASDIFEVKDYWNRILAKDTVSELDAKLMQYYENLPHGIRAEQQRKVDAFTSYDGMVAIDEAIYDPRQNKDRLMTAGKLEQLAACPYAYFLAEILKVKPVEDVSYDPYAWLDAATRGSLLHSVFETFYKSLKRKNEQPFYASHKALITQIAQAHMDEYKQLQPPPSARIFELEREDIMLCCDIFLKEEEAHGKDYEAQEFEYTFGIGDTVPAKITLASQETISVSGKIDRVDKSADGDYHIIDYKTGGTYSYAENDYFKGGRQLQHFIYAAAIEEHLKLESGSVKESAYYFPSTKGLGERYVRKQDDHLRTNGHDILERLVDVIKHGHFTMTDDVNDCKFCDFKSVCRRAFYAKETLEVKQIDQDAVGLQKFKGIRAYE
ncbi:PD-(D/E)XK nuclease family protein [Radiobacillus sp. PE A8.2]|uniref:PD-(D/E)XK nuclease family protein n=1 Tax=Radiobacillus sp. PE A8.2 TaxID=3380349 RepID=UPI00388DB304